jgi:hypothetical protein
MSNKIKVAGYAQKIVYIDGIEYRDFTPDLVGLQFASNGGTPLFTMGNFAITTNLEPKVNKIFISNKFSNFVSLSDLNVNVDTNKELLNNNAIVILNLDKTNLNNYALFGSLSEYIRVSLENIIINWPASLYMVPISQNASGQILNGYTFEDYTYDSLSEISSFKINTTFINNKFNLNILENGNIVDSFNATNDLRNVTVNYPAYVVLYNGIEYPLLDFTAATYNTNDYIYLNVSGDPFSGLGAFSKVKYHIKPEKIKEDTFFNSLPNLEYYLLSRDITPLYTATFKYQIKSEMGFILYVTDTVTWPVSDGYNIDFNTTEYVDYATKLLDISSKNDLIQSNLMTRFLVSESISDFDTTPVFLSDLDKDTSGQKINKTLQIYGRGYDEINNFISGIAFSNVVSYDKQDNTPDIYLKNLARVLGWDLVSSVLENNLLANYVTNKPSTFSGQSIGLTAVEADTELWRRLILNTPWLWKSKGARKSIEFILKFIGAPLGLVSFNEYVYRAENPIDVELFKEILTLNNLDTDISTYPIDLDGFPIPLPDTKEMYFQNDGLWYRETGGSASTIDIYTGNNPHLGPYDGGSKYINQFRNLISNFSAVTITSQTITTSYDNLYTNYDFGKFDNGVTTATIIDTVQILDTDNVDISNCVDFLPSVDINPNKLSYYNDCGCDIESSDNILDLTVKSLDFSRNDGGICNLTNEFKLVLNPNGNDGVLFTTTDNENEEYNLNIDFDFLIKIKCNSLSNLLTDSYTTPISSDEIEIITAIEQENVIITTLENEISLLTTQIENTNYSIICESLPNQNSRSVKTNSLITDIFSNTAFGNTNTTTNTETQNKAPLSQSINGVNFCIQEPIGLNEWFNVLGASKFQGFLNGDQTSYTCTDVQTIYTLNETLLFNRTIDTPLIEPCTTPFGTKTSLINDFDTKTQELLVAKNRLAILNEALTLINQGQPVINCINPIDLFENISLSLSLDVVTGASVNNTVFLTNDLFPQIGTGLLYNYIITTPNTGFYVCGDNTEPLNLNLNGLSKINDYGCDSILDSITNDLFIESGLTGVTNGLETFSNSISNSALTSNWLHHTSTITDQNIIKLLIDKKIRFNIIIKNACTEVSLLLDNIKLEKVTNKLKKIDIIVAKNPGFKLDRVIDNKKSWVVNQSQDNRNFSINKVNNLNPIRKTNYDLNDSRLILNSKELDLDVNLASAIETDVWRYIGDNNCLLTGVTTCNPCDDCLYKSFQDDTCFEFMDVNPYEFMDGNYTGGSMTNDCCGDNGLNFNDLLNQPLSSVTTIEEFKYYLTSELIDAKNRKTISGYPTLKALYDRYLSSNLYCGNNSSGFNYLSMEQFSNLLGDYWVDIIEQVIPATTIWGSVKIYSNTIFDQQKFKYRAYSTLFCSDDLIGETLPSPINSNQHQYRNVDVILQNINKKEDDSFITKPQTTTTCNKLYITQMNSSSEFVGSVKIIDGKTEPSKCDIIANISVDIRSTDNIILTVDAFNGLAPYTYLWNTNETTASINGENDTTYTCEIMDSNYCKKSVSVTIPALNACVYVLPENPEFLMGSLYFDLFSPIGTACDPGSNDLNNFIMSIYDVTVNGNSLLNTTVSTNINQVSVNWVQADNDIVYQCTLGEVTGQTYTNFVDLMNTTFNNLGLTYYKAQIAKIPRIIYSTIQGPQPLNGFYIIRPNTDTFSIKADSNTNGDKYIYTEDKVKDWNTVNSWSNAYPKFTCTGITMNNSIVVE